MREQHAHGYFVPAIVIVVKSAIVKLTAKFRDDRRDRRFEIEQAALIEDHGHGGRGDDFGERGEIEEASCVDLGRSRIIRETAESFVGDKFSAKCDGERAGWKSSGGNRLFEDAEGAAKAIVLRGKTAHQKRKSRLSVRQRQLQGLL